MTSEARAKEEAGIKVRRVFRKQHEQSENRQEWIRYHDDQAHKHLALARDHFQKKTRLVGEDKG